MNNPFFMILQGMVIGLILVGWMSLFYISYRSLKDEDYLAAGLSMFAWIAVTMYICGVIFEAIQGRL